MCKVAEKNLMMFVNTAARKDELNAIQTIGRSLLIKNNQSYLCEYCHCSTDGKYLW